MNKGHVMAIEVVGTIIHLVTYFLLIFLPIKWHGVKVRWMGIGDAMFAIFWNLSLLPFKIVWDILLIVFMLVSYVLYFPAKIIWNSVGLLFRMPWHVCVRLIRGGSPKSPLRAWTTSASPEGREMPTIVAKLAPLILSPVSGSKSAAKLEETLPLLETLESIPQPTCSACCNTTCCNNFAMRMRRARQFM